MKKRPAVSRYGERFGRLVVLPIEPEVRVSPSGFKFAYMTVQCDCGTVFKTYLGRLTCNKVVSCGCLGKEKSSARIRAHNTTHGGSGTTEYKIWQGMRYRCSIESATGYNHYGGRGVTVCDRWASFENFLSDMGKRPSPAHSVDRIDPNGPYSPENCRWATVSEQANNKRNNVFVDIGGQKLTLAKAANLFGFSRSNVYKYMNRLGVSHQQAVDFILRRNATL